MTPELELVETAAYVQQYTGLAPEHRGLVAPLGGLTAFGVAAWPDSAWHATVTGLHESPPPARLDAALALLERLGARSPVLPVVEQAVPREVMTERGFTVGTPLLRMAARTDLVLAADDVPVAVRPVGPEGGAVVATVCLKGFGGGVDQAWWRAGLGRPGWTQVVAYAGESPVGTGALFVDGDEAWIGSATVVPQARRRGVHRALLAARLRLASEQGAGRVSVKCAPGGASHASLSRAGFAEAQRLVQWRRPGA